MRIAMALLMMLLAQAQSHGQSEGCLSGIGQKIGGYVQMTPTCVTYINNPDTPGGFDVDGNGTIDYLKGTYTAPGDDSCHTVTFYPQGLLNEIVENPDNPKWPNADYDKLKNGLAMCTPYAKAYMFFIMTHEFLHSKCGGHADDPADPDNDPSHGQPGHDEHHVPDCPGVSIAIGTAKHTCSEACKASQCVADPDSCDPSEVDPDFESVDDVEEYLEGLCDVYADMQNRWNGGEFQADALACACPDEGYTPPAGCDDVDLPVGFDCDSDPPPDMAGQAWPIPDCMCDDGLPNCPAGS